MCECVVRIVSVDKILCFLSAFHYLLLFTHIRSVSRLCAYNFSLIPGCSYKSSQKPLRLEVKPRSVIWTCVSTFGLS